jgi:putative membrane protein
MEAARESGPMASNGIMSAPLSPAQTLADTAAAADAFEIRSSELALDKATAPAIKAFARRMVDAHIVSSEKLKAAASAATPAIVPNPTLTPEQDTQLEELKGMQEVDFDRAYLSAQVSGHRKTLAALQAYAANGDVPQLRTFAAATAPTVATHLGMARALSP